MPNQIQLPPYLNRFFTGVISERSALSTPFSFGPGGFQIIQRHDALLDGLNMEVSPDFTLVRRPGHLRFCSVQLGDEIPTAFYSARINNTVHSILDTTTRFCVFTSSSITTLWTKISGAGQTFKQEVGNKLYFADGIVHKKWDGSIVTNCGIVPPASAPTQGFTRGDVCFWRPNAAPPAGGIFVIIDNNGNFQQSLLAGATGATLPVWATGINQTTADGSQSWLCCGPYQTWQPSTFYFGNQIVVDNHGNLQQLSTPTAGGTSGTSTPTFNTTVFGTSTDGTLTWREAGLLASGSGDNGSGQITIQAGYQWGYCYHTTSGHVSTMSPATLSSGLGIEPFLVPLSGAYSLDTQCDFIWLFRTTDGGATYQFLDQVVNNPAGGTWTYNDFKTDAQLNPLILAPINHANDPPPAGMKMLAYHMGRRWGAVGNLVYFAAGPDTVTGNGDESWPPANVFPFPSNITGLAHTSSGLLVTLKDQMWIILGGPQTLTFFPQQIFENFGISSPNCMAQDGDVIYAYLTSREFYQFSINGRQEIGANIRTKLALTFDPTSSYVTVHRNGSDYGVFISDNIFNMRRYDLNFDAWSTVAQLSGGGVGAIGSIETDLGEYGLMVGRTSDGSFILERDLNGWSDDGATYTGFSTIGSITISQPGMTPPAVESIVLQYSNAGSLLSLGVLLNEISGNFINVPISADDPWQYPGSQTLRMKRHDIRAAQVSPNLLIRHMQIQINLTNENAKNEILGIAICPEVK